MKAWPLVLSSFLFRPHRCRLFKLEMDARLQQQVRVSKMLGVGFACSILGVGGITSVIAIAIGLKARKIITASNGEIVGIVMAWWCIVVGVFGLLTLPLTIYFLIKIQ